MDIQLLENKFARLQARIKIRDQARRRMESGFAIDIREDDEGEFFDIFVPPGEALEVEAIDVRPELRHLLLMVRQNSRKDKFLCGHDERHWFVAAVPGNGISTVRTALQALKPEAVREVEEVKHLRTKERSRRRNRAFIRQGEWFFIPEPGLEVKENLILRNEPLSRGAGSKPHVCEEAYRSGGVTVYVCRQRPGGLLEEDYKALLEQNPEANRWSWQVMKRDAQVYARGSVRHKDHGTVYLNGWHRVLMNTENEAPAMRHVVFLD